MTTLTVHTVDRMKTSMKSTLPDTLDIFEMQRRRHDLAQKLSQNGKNQVTKTLSTWLTQRVIDVWLA